MSTNPRIEDDDADRLSGSVGQPTRHDYGVSEWPDDGLPVRVASARRRGTLHPLGLIGTLLGRS